MNTEHQVLVERSYLQYPQFEDNPYLLLKHVLSTYPEITKCSFSPLKILSFRQIIDKLVKQRNSVSDINKKSNILVCKNVGLR